MIFAELDWTSIALRVFVYIATIAVAGGVFIRATPGMREMSGIISAQIAAGIALLFISEPLRYLAFQLSIAQGDWSMAFDPAMRWMGLETPLGQASAARLVGAAFVLVGFLWRPLSIAGALIVIGSYLLEGHTVSSDTRIGLASLLFLHLLIVHWWMGALVPLRTALQGENNKTVASTVEQFGRLAVAAVAVLFVAGALTLLILTNWKLDLNQAYQQGFALKLLAFAAILLIAAVNKLCWTPLLETEPERGKRGLRAWLIIEMMVAGCILIATATALSFPPAEH